MELYAITQVYPNDDDVPEGSNLIWALAWKYLSDGRLIVPQIRPFPREEE